MATSLKGKFYIGVGIESEFAHMGAELPGITDFHGDYSTWRAAVEDLARKGWKRVADNRWEKPGNVAYIKEFNFMSRSSLPSRNS